VEQAAAAAAAAAKEKAREKRAAPVAVDPLSGEAIFDQDGRDAGKAVLGACWLSVVAHWSETVGLGFSENGWMRAGGGGGCTMTASIGLLVLLLLAGLF
jgi:hypothetical protein